MLSSTIEEGSESDEEEEEDSEQDQDPSDEDKTGSAAPDNSRDSGISNADIDKGRQSDNDGKKNCPQVNGINTDEESEKEARPS